MSTINSSTTGHSRPQERKFSNKLFIGLILAVVASVIIFLIAGQTSKTDTSDAPAPVQDQTK